MKATQTRNPFTKLALTVFLLGSASFFTINLSLPLVSRSLVKEELMQPTDKLLGSTAAEWADIATFNSAMYGPIWILTLAGLYLRKERAAKLQPVKVEEA